MADPRNDAEQWTDDQEICLLKAIIQFKPVGMHKNFRMLAIRNYMTNQGMINAEDQHTSIPGIKRKLDSMYDMAKLDEREDSIINDNTDDNGETVPYWREFELPRADYERMMWERRLDPEGTQSPEWSRRESTVADTDEPRSSPMSVRGSTRGGRASGRRGGRLSRLQNELETERSSRRTSKANSVVDEDQQTEDAEDDEEDDSDEEEEEESSEDQDEDEKPKSARRGRGGGRGRGRRGRRRG